MVRRQTALFTADNTHTRSPLRVPAENTIKKAKVRYVVRYFPLGRGWPRRNVFGGGFRKKSGTHFNCGWGSRLIYVNMDYLHAGYIFLSTFCTVLFAFMFCFFSIFRQICKLTRQKTLQRRNLRYVHANYCAGDENNVIIFAFECNWDFLCCIFQYLNCVFAINAGGCKQ